MTVETRLTLRERAKRAMAEAEEEARKAVEQSNVEAVREAVTRLTLMLDSILGLSCKAHECMVKKVAEYCGGTGAYRAVVEIEGIPFTTGRSTGEGGKNFLAVEMPNGFPYTTAINSWADLGRVLDDLDKVAAQS